jgi:hypothetical protein
MHLVNSANEVTMNKTGLAVGLLAIIGAAQKADAYSMAGAGWDSCASWSVSRHTYGSGGGIATPGYQNTLKQTHWVLGFLSGIGSLGHSAADPLARMEADAVLAWVDNYCNGHPNDNVAKAATAFYHTHPH